MLLRQDVRVSLLLLDSASLYYRAFYALPTTIRSPGGEAVNAVRGFLETLGRLLDARRPRDVIACWDLDWRPEWRVAAVPTYKTHRVAEGSTGTEEEPDELGPQTAVIRACLAALGIPVAGAAGFEADDVIATLAARAHGRCDIVSGDRDLLALVTDDVHVLYTGRPGVPWTEYAPADVLMQFGVTPAQYADFALLRGDASDGLPGVRGIGEKTAARLLTQFGELDALLLAAADPAAPMTPAVRRTLTESSDYIARARRVVSLVRNIDLATTAITPTAPDDDALDNLASTFGIRTALAKVRALLPPPGQVVP